MRPFALALVMVVGCSGGGGDDTQKAKLASDLVGCRNDVAVLKEQLAEAKAQLAKREADRTVTLEPIDLKAQEGAGKHMEGNVSPDAVVKVVRQNSGGLRACYEHALKRKPDLQFVSNVSAHFAVENSGSASSVSFTPHTDVEMERCMAQTIKKWHFPTFQGDAVAFVQPVNLVAK